MKSAVIFMATPNYLRVLVLFCFAAAGLYAGEHHGQVLFGGLPVPGATITATQADKRLVAVTDAKGVYTFKDLADGNWKFHVDMLCFAPIDREVVIAPGAPDAIWEMKLLPFSEIQAAAGPQAPKPPVSQSNAPKPAAATPQQVSQATPPAPAPDTPSLTGRRKAKTASQTQANPQSGFKRAGLTHLPTETKSPLTRPIPVRARSTACL